MLIHPDDPYAQVIGLLGTSAPCSTALFDRNDPFVRFLVDHRHRTFYLKPYNGNSGDALIWLGAEQLLKDLQINRTMNPETADVILVPGGNQTMWPTNVEMWKQVWSKWPDKDFVVGPTTVRLGVTTWDDDVRRSKARVRAIFARDPESYAVLNACGLGKDILTGLSHDPAVYLRSSPLIRQQKQAGTEEFVLAAFRDDHEATSYGHKCLGKLVDLGPHCLSRRIHRHWQRARLRGRVACVARSTNAAQPLKILDVSLCSFQLFLETVRSAAEVHTDRLHCMLLAVMLGKPTFAYPTAYGKLEAVYNHSIKEWGHVEFVGSAPPVAERDGRTAEEASPRTAVIEQPAL